MNDLMFSVIAGTLIGLAILFIIYMNDVLTKLEDEINDKLSCAQIHQEEQK